MGKTARGGEGVTAAPSGDPSACLQVIKKALFKRRGLTKTPRLTVPGFRRSSALFVIEPASV
jgi:hypothetical protein